MQLTAPPLDRIAGLNRGIRQAPRARTWCSAPGGCPTRGTWELESGSSNRWCLPHALMLLDTLLRPRGGRSPVAILNYPELELDADTLENVRRGGFDVRRRA